MSTLDDIDRQIVQDVVRWVESFGFGEVNLEIDSAISDDECDEILELIETTK